MSLPANILMDGAFLHLIPEAAEASEGVTTYLIILFVLQNLCRIEKKNYVKGTSFRKSSFIFFPVFFSHSLIDNECFSRIASPTPIPL